MHSASASSTPKVAPPATAAEGHADRASRRPLGTSALLLAIAALGAHSGCERLGVAPAAAAAPKPAEPTYVSSLPRPAAPARHVTHTLADGETLWDIARAYGVTSRSLMEVNGLTPEDARRLRSGRQLTIEVATDGPSQGRPEGAPVRDATELATMPELKDGAYHVLAQGESLWTLARLYDVPLERLMARNGWSEDIHGHLRIGQPIIIPGIHAGQIKQRKYDIARSGITHSVNQGETVWDIARRYAVGVGEIMAANGLRPEQVQGIRAGQKLFMPGVREDARGRVHRVPSARDDRARVVAQRLGLGTLQTAGKLLHGQVEPRWIAAAGSGQGLAGTLRWPVAQGWFVRGFGSGQGGYHKAMDIMGQMGWNVRAAAGGIVGYAGNAVSGFGNMVMVVHSGGWVTLYAHNSVNFVSAGERVDKGSILAEVGSTGRSDGPHVHFELIHQGNNCDPAPLFRPGVRVRSGRFADLAYTSWRDPARRPRQVKCQRRQKHPQVMLESPSLDEEPLL